jgi:hypothetical protein
LNDQPSHAHDARVVPHSSAPRRDDGRCGWACLHWKAALAIAVLTLFFLREPILRFGSAHYSCADLVQGWTMTRATPWQPPANQTISDPAVEMQPWTLLARSELSQGRFPHWNPFNGLGAPLFANYQSGVLSVFNLPFYVLGMRAALVLSAFLKLFAIGYCTYLFLRATGAGRWGALLGAVAFEFSGHNVVLLGYPHAGVMAVLPAGVLFVELAAQRASAGGGWRHAVPALVGLFLTFALGLLAGHPEVFYFAAAGTGLYALARLWVVARDASARGRAWRPTGGLLAGLVIAAALACGAGAIQLLPFFEYLERSTMMGLRAGMQTPLFRINWPLHLFPDVYGAATDHRRPDPNLPLINYEASISDYAGGTVLLLALVALWFARRQWRVGLFALGALLWLCYGYNLFGFAELVSRVPGVGMAPINRSQGLYSFALACLAGWAVDGLLCRPGKPAPLLALTALAWTGALLALAWAGATARIEGMNLSLRTPPEFMADVRSHMRSMAGSLLAAGGCVALLGWFAGPRLRAGLVALLGLSIWVQTAGLLKDYNPTTDDRYFFPSTMYTRGLRAAAGDEPVVILGNDAIPPCTNILHGITLLSNYDAMGVKNYDRLLAEKFGAQGNWQLTQTMNLNALALFGVRWVFWLERIQILSESTKRAQWNTSAEYRTPPLEPGRVVRQELKGLYDQLQSVAVWVERQGEYVPGEFELALFDVETGARVASRRWPIEDLLNNGRGDANAILSFDPLPNSRGRRYRLTAQTHGTMPERNVKLIANLLAPKFLVQRELDALQSREPFQAAGRLTQVTSRWPAFANGERLPGALVVDAAYGHDLMQLVDRIGDHHLYRWKEAPGRAFFVDQALVVRGEAQARDYVKDNRFDPRNFLVLTRSEGPVVVPQRKARTRACSFQRVHPTEVRVLSENGESGWVYLAMPYYPGWRATLNGREAPLEQANAAFMAVAVEPGKNEIVLTFSPRSFHLGLGISVLSAALAVALAAWNLAQARGAVGAGFATPAGPPAPSA